MASIFTIATDADAQESRSVGIMAFAKSPPFAEIWDRFKADCEHALTDPQDFVVTHPTRGSDGAQLVARTPDNQIVSLYWLGENGVYRGVTIIGVPGELQIACEASGGDSMADIGQWPELAARREQEVRNYVSQRPGAVVVGGVIPSFDTFTGMPGGMPDSPMMGIQVTFAGKPRLAHAFVTGDSVNLYGIYRFEPELAAQQSAAPPPDTASSPPVNQETATSGEPQIDTDGPAALMRSVTEICLRNYRTPDAALPALEQSGMTLSPMGGKTFEIAGRGIWGVVDPGAEPYCTVQSPEVTLDSARKIGSDTANALFPGDVQPGAPEGGNGPCDGLSIFAPRQMIWLRYAQAGNSGECIDDGTSAIIIN